jgi:hypothetical protein
MNSEEAIMESTLLIMGTLKDLFGVFPLSWITTNGGV